MVRVLLEQQFSKMPKTKAFIEQALESEPEYRLSGQHYVIQAMREAGKII
jgi:hypothetical protein